MIPAVSHGGDQRSSMIPAISHVETKGVSPAVSHGGDQRFSMIPAVSHGRPKVQCDPSRITLETKGVIPAVSHGVDQRSSVLQPGLQQVESSLVHIHKPIFLFL